MQNDRLRTALGFAAKAGKCISGDFGAERAVKDKKALIIALDNGVSAATRERSCVIFVPNALTCTRF